MTCNQVYLGALWNHKQKERAIKMGMEHETLAIVTDALSLDGVTVEVTHPNTGLARYGAGIILPATCDVVAIVDHSIEEQFVSQAA